MPVSVSLCQNEGSAPKVLRICICAENKLPEICAVKQKYLTLRKCGRRAPGGRFPYPLLTYLLHIYLNSSLLWTRL